MRRSLLGAVAVLALLAPAAAQTGGNAGAKMPMTQGGNAGASTDDGASTNNGAAGANGNGRMNAGSAQPMPQDNSARAQGNTPDMPDAGKGAGAGQQGRQDADGRQNMQNGPKQNDQADQKPMDGKQNNRRTASRGDIGSARTKIVQNKTVIEKNITRTDVRLPAGISIAVGVALPATIAYMPVPAAILAVVPEFEGYDYIVVNGQILFVDPATYEIVYVMPV